LRIPILQGFKEAVRGFSLEVRHTLKARKLRAFLLPIFLHSKSEIPLAHIRSWQ
jgi:hypothetical protein